MKKILIATLLIANLTLACGPGTNPGNRKKKTPGPEPTTTPGVVSTIMKLFAPLWSSGQTGATAATPASCASLAGRPCAKAKASIGSPYQFDTNTTDGASIAGGVPTNPKVTAAGAGKTSVASGRLPVGPNFPVAGSANLKSLQQ